VERRYRKETKMNTVILLFILFFVCVLVGQVLYVNKQLYEIKKLLSPKSEASFSKALLKGLYDR
jgi:hypothetical protein